MVEEGGLRVAASTGERSDDRRGEREGGFVGEKRENESGGEGGVRERERGRESERERERRRERGAVFCSRAMDASP